MKTLLALVSFLLASSAVAAPRPRQNYASYGTVISSVALDTASSTFAIDLSNPAINGLYGLMTVWVSVTDADNSTTAVNMSCTASPNGGTSDYTIQDCETVTAGVCSSVGASWTKNPSAAASPKRWPWRVDIEGLPQVECTFTDTGGVAADSITVTVTFATKG